MLHQRPPLNLNFWLRGSKIEPKIAKMTERAKIRATENSIKTYLCAKSENRFTVSVFSVVPSLASLATERQKVSVDH